MLEALASPVEINIGGEYVGSIAEYLCGSDSGANR
jgi:hypothetical protein